MVNYVFMYAEWNIMLVSAVKYMNGVRLIYDQNYLRTYML